MAALTSRAVTKGGATLGVAMAVLATLTLVTPPALAADDPSEPPGTVTTSPPPEVDANSPA